MICKRTEHGGSGRPLGVVGLFAGIGGIELGLSRAGHETVLLCENDPAASAVLRARFPDIPLVPDIRSLEGLPDNVDLVAAGVPCQDLSQAGSTRGIAGDRSGLVGEVFRLLETREVPWLLIENVPFMLKLGRGAAMNYIINSLERLGYRWAYRVIDTLAFGLPQRRERVFLLASLETDPAPLLFEGNFQPTLPKDHTKYACGFYWTEGVRGLGWAVDAVPTLKGGSTVGIPSPPAIWLPRGRIVTPNIRDAERLQGFGAGWTKAAETVGRSGFRWKLVGNAVSVPVAAWLGGQIAKAGKSADWMPTGLVQDTWPKCAHRDGRQRVEVSLTTWPVARKRTALEQFLRFEPKELSHRATAGFIRRFSSSTLRSPAGFTEALTDHLERMARGNAVDIA